MYNVFHFNINSGIDNEGDNDKFSLYFSLVPKSCKDIFSAGRRRNGAYTMEAGYQVPIKNSVLPFFLMSFIYFSCIALMRSLAAYFFSEALGRSYKVQKVA